MIARSTSLGVCLGLLLGGCTSSTPPSLSAPATSTVNVAPTTRAGRGVAGPKSGAPPDAAQRPPTRSAPTLDTSVFFADIQVVGDPSLQPSELRLHVRVADGPFGELTRRGLAGNVRGGTLLVRIPDGYPESHDPATPRHRTCSYVVDCDAQAIESMGKNLLPAQPSIAELVSFTGQRVSVKSLSRGFDIASEVATSREGDCSEHAVLLAALARRHHFAARVVFGFAILRFSHRLPLLVGHAWTEIYDGQNWILGDAALADLDYRQIAGFLQLHYLPVSVLEHEDAGFRAKLLTLPGVFSVERADAASRHLDAAKSRP